MKKSTVIIDLDGVIFIHKGGGSAWYGEQALVPGVKERIDKLEGQGACIVIMTARKESARFRTERQLECLGICYDKLIMGVTSGLRVLINDTKPDGDFGCIAINQERDANDPWIGARSW